MSIVKAGRRWIRRIIFGDTLLPHGVTLGLADPQTEIAVWLDGLGAPIDVTHRHSMACASPLTVSIAFGEDQEPGDEEIRQLRLKFRERGGRKELLGELSLRPAGSISTDGSKICLFEVRKTRNCCLPHVRLWAHDLLRAYKNWRRTDASALEMSLAGMRAMTVMFIRPHPVVLVSHPGDGGGNIFPMNLMGELGNGYFGFALVDSREAAIGVERAGCIAVSSVPFAQAAFAFQLAANHFHNSADWKSLPFATRPSSTFGIPVPAFAARVRELEIVHTGKIGSHRFFVARIVRDAKTAECENLHLIDGIYHAWRVKGRAAELETSLSADSLNKRGVYNA
jgi:flavin reductase (DIM6/NTAB) family NADH-FMN oxidoreductase RutF